MSNKTDTKPATTINLTPGAAAISKAIIDGYKIDENHAILVDKKFFHSHLPEGVTPELYDKVEAFQTDAFVGLNHAVGTLGEAHLKSHKNVKEVSGVLPLGKATASTVYHRTFQQRGIGGAEPVERHGWLVPKFTTSVGNRSSVSMKNLRSALAESGAKLFG